jgi:hypothetical protein
MRFSPPSEPARVAVFAGAEHPLARHAMFYECVDRAVAALGAEAVFVHAELADPAGLPPHLRARLGTGLYVPFALEVEANDLAHFERTAPVRLHRLAEALARHADGTVGEVLAYGEFRQAVHVARWVQGLGASAVLSLGLDAGAFRAFVVSELLDLPRVAAFAEVLPVAVLHPPVLAGLPVLVLVVILAADDAGPAGRRDLHREVADKAGAAAGGLAPAVAQLRFHAGLGDHVAEFGIHRRAAFRRGDALVLAQARPVALAQDDKILVAALRREVHGITLQL